MSAAIHQGDADLLLEIADLPAERGLRGIELLLGGDGKTACIGHGDEVAEMPELHHNLPYLAGMGGAYKVFFKPASALYSKKRGSASKAGLGGADPSGWTRRPARQPYWSLRMGKGIGASLLLLLVTTGLGGA